VVKKIAVVCFGAMREYLPDGASLNRAELEVPDDAHVGDVVDALGAPRRLIFSVLVQGRRASLSDAVDDGAEVTLMPPFTGG
jgi:hypothetical protein